MTAPSLHWPAERFFWSLLDGADLPKGAIGRDAAAVLDLALENDLPVAIEHVHAVYVRLGPALILACAAQRDELTTVPIEVITLCPASVPDFVPAQAIDPQRLNLLVDEFEPAPLRRLRVKRSVLVAATLVLCSLVGSLGVWRRANVWLDEASATQAAVRRLLTALAPGSEPGSALMSVKSEVERLRATRRVPTQATPDASITLASLLLAWPRDEGVQTEVISVTPGTLSMSVVLADPKSFLQSLQAPGGWTLEEPKLSVGAAGTQVSVQFQRAGGSP